MALVAVTDEVVATAGELADREGLRAYDAVHLAAAQVVGAVVLATADAALGRAAGRHGLHVADPLG